MAVEHRRGCGHRKIGGTYLEGDPGPGYLCGRLPLAVKPCPLCDQRPAFTRGLQRVTPLNLLHGRRAVQRDAHALPCLSAERGGCPGDRGAHVGRRQVLHAGGLHQGSHAAWAQQTGAMAAAQVV